MKLTIMIIMTIIMVTVVACSTGTGLDEQIARLQEREGISSLHPDFPIIPVDFGPMAKTVAETTDDQKDGQSEHPYRQYSNRKIYFMVLWQQYQDLKSYAYGESLPEIKSCPSFHSALIEAQEVKEKGSGMNERSLPVTIHSAIQRKAPLSRDEIALYPELSLSTAVNQKAPKVFETTPTKKMTLGKSLAKALNGHLQRNYAELQELCRFGYSENYYAFENLINYMQEHQDYRNSLSSFKSLLKTPMYGNLLILFSLQLEFSPEKTSVETLFSSNLSKEFVQRLDAQWSTMYFKELERKRMELKSGRSYRS